MKVTIDNSEMHCVAELDARASNGMGHETLAQEIVRDHDHPIIQGVRVRMGWDERGIEVAIPLEEEELDDLPYIKEKVKQAQEWLTEQIDRLVELKRDLEIIRAANERGAD